MNTTLERPRDGYPYRDFGVILKRARKQRGISQSLLAKHSGVSIRMIQEYEQGRSFPSGGRVLRIIAALRVNPKTLDEIVRYQTEMANP